MKVDKIGTMFEPFFKGKLKSTHVFNVPLFV